MTYEFHENLDPAINMNLAMSERNGGVFLKDVLPGGSVLVKTRNSLYTLVNHDDRWMGQGGQRLPEMREIQVHGSTFGGSMLKTKFIGIGMHLEFNTPVLGGFKSFEELGEHIITTTAIESIVVRLPEGGTIYDCLAQIMFGHPDVDGKEVRDAKRFMFAQVYGSSEDKLAWDAALEPKRVKEIIDLLQLIELPDGEIAFICHKCGNGETVKPVRWDGESGTYPSAIDFCSACEEPRIFREEPEA